jgi:acetyltransferase-like isoleucine patch superfamily enzyme
VSIGDRVLIGYRTQILSSNHCVPPAPQRIFGAGHTKEAIAIENDVWIGGNCVILAGVTIGEGSVVAAGSVVTKDIPPYCYAGGVPARVIKRRN